MSGPYGSMDADQIAARLGDRTGVFERARALAPEVARAGEVLVRSLEGGGTVFACGNGGSATKARTSCWNWWGASSANARAARFVARGERGYPDRDR